MTEMIRAPNSEKQDETASQQLPNSEIIPEIPSKLKLLLSWT